MEAARQRRRSNSGPEIEEELDHHDYHCATCHFLLCTNDACPLVECPSCGIHLHNCKVYDHTEICPMAVVPCLNVEYGCDKELRRDKMVEHLEICPASCVVCPEETQRKSLNRLAKDLLKCWARNDGIPAPSVPIRNDEFDVIVSAADQRKICEAYRFSRKTRAACTDGMNSDPILPLRALLDYNGNPFSTIAADDEADSEDEAATKYLERKKKVDNMFSGCLICLKDPTRQHFHTLGDGKGIANYTINRRETPPVIERFFTERSLAISTTAAFPANINKKFAYNERRSPKDGKLFRLRCERTVRRDEWSAHLLLSHSTTQNDLDKFVLRCPLWCSGCPFYTLGTDAALGELQFSNYLDTFEIVPRRLETDVGVSAAESDESWLLSLPISLVEHICDFLESSSLRSLAATCRSIRALLFTELSHRAVVSLEWTKKEGHWVPGRKMWSFSVSCRREPEWRIIPTARADVASHLLSCAFNKRIEHPDRVPMLPLPFLQQLPIPQYRVM